MEIVFGKPYTKITESGVRLCCRIDGMMESPFVLWYEVDETYADCLCTERSDAFFVGMLPHIMAASSSETPTTVTLKQPLSERIYYQTLHAMMPTLTQAGTVYSPIVIECDVDSTLLPSRKAVATGVSGGVDSFYTLLTNKDTCAPDYKVTHGLYCDMGLYGPIGGEGEKLRWDYSNGICEEMNITPLKVSTNICSDIYKIGHDMIVTYMFASVVLALQKLFSVYYISSGYAFKEFKVDEFSAPAYDLLSVYAFSNENVQLFASGAERSRIDKVRAIADNPVVHKYLNVCVKPDAQQRNCGRCSKCSRTMLELYANEKLDEFADIFDVAYFKKNPNYYFGYLYMKGSTAHFMSDILKRMGERNLKIPFGARIIGLYKLAKNGFHRTNPLATEYRP